MITFLSAIGLVALCLTAWAVTQKEHTLLRIYGPVALIRWLFEAQRDKLNQYRERAGEGRPFSLISRSWIYRASKKLPVSEGFGTQKDLHVPGTHTIRPAAFGYTKEEIPDAAFNVKVGRGQRFFNVRYPLNRSGGSFGAFGAHWTRAASDGGAVLSSQFSRRSGFLDNTGEGGLAPHHLSVNPVNQIYLDELNKRARARGHSYVFRFDRTATSDGKIVEVPLDLNRGLIDDEGRYIETNPTGRHGASELPRNLIVQIGPSLSGFRTAEGSIDWDWLDMVCSLPDVVGVEVKGQQGAKPNDGGTVKAAKLTAELRALRGFNGEGDYVSPERLPFIRPLDTPFSEHVPARPDARGFRGSPVDREAHAVEKRVSLSEQVGDLCAVLSNIQNLSNVRARGLITGYKMTYCGEEFLTFLASFLRNNNGPDYLIVDGAEGGTGSADPMLTDHVGVHTYQGIVRTNQILTRLGVRDRIKLVASGRIVTPADVAKAMCLGADYCNSIRGYMMSTGCIQATECHTGKCPTGITTHNSWRLRGFDPTLKAVRFANYGEAVRNGVAKLARVAGVNFLKSEQFTLDHLDVVTGVGKLTRGSDVYKES